MKKFIIAALLFTGMVNAQSPEAEVAPEVIDPPAYQTQTQPRTYEKDQVYKDDKGNLIKLLKPKKFPMGYKGWKTEVTGTDGKKKTLYYLNENLDALQKVK